jgi:hypothetical protein
MVDAVLAAKTMRIDWLLDYCHADFSIRRMCDLSLREGLSIDRALRLDNSCARIVQAATVAAEPP